MSSPRTVLPGHMTHQGGKPRNPHTHSSTMEGAGFLLPPVFGEVGRHSTSSSSFGLLLKVGAGLLTAWRAAGCRTLPSASFVPRMAELCTTSLPDVCLRASPGMKSFPGADYRLRHRMA